MLRRLTFGQAVLGLLVVIIALPTTINDGISGWAVWLGWLDERQWQYGLFALGLLTVVAATVAQVILYRKSASHAEAHRQPITAAPESTDQQGQAEPQAEPGPAEMSVGELPPPAARALAEKTARHRLENLLVARAAAARDLRAAFDEYIETFLTRRAQYKAGMSGEELDRAREEYGRLQRGVARAYRAVREHYRRFLNDEPQYDRSSADFEDYVPEEPLPRWWQPLTFDEALETYANADDDHLRRFIAEERAILEAFAEWIAEPRAAP
jgi:hypothetical protein